MSEESGKFHVEFASGSKRPLEMDSERILLGRLETCDVVLDDGTVSRLHAAISFTDSRYSVVNLSTSNPLTLNGRFLESQEQDVLAAGDTIQIGPFAIFVKRADEDSISLVVQEKFADSIANIGLDTMTAADAPSRPSIDDVLKVFWEKRTREKEDWGTRLRPTEKPRPGKAMFNWRPTGDLKRPWRVGLFVWAFLIVGVVGALAFFKYPNVYEPKPLATAHASDIRNSPIAVEPNANSCTTCHAPNAPIENSCIHCHKATEFQASNTEAHERAGVTCTTCHKQHEGAGFDMSATAIRSCAECHNDNNRETYNGKTVRTPHGGSYGYPAEDGMWKWKGVYAEVASAIPEIADSATGDKDEQAKLSRQFHTIHVARLVAPEGVKADSRGLVTCSSCHKTFEPIDRTTPRQTCAACHTTPLGAESRDARFGADTVNCISCHVQHPFSGHRWSEFLTADAAERRRVAVINKIKELGGR
jgi:pSer/pThr/pTyr-binding forkhead associated (FHA) protein